MSVLAIDAGTTGVTAAVVTPEGTIAAKGRQEFSQRSPKPGWVEHTPEEIWQATLGATREVLTKVDKTELTAIGITNQRDTILVWDRETLGSPRPAIVSQDRRAADICMRLREQGHEVRVTELTGLRLDPRFSGTKLTWLAESEPHTWANVESGRYAIGTVDSYLIARMTRGTWHVTDVSNASRTLLFDLHTGDWSGELCDLFGVPRDALPELVPSWGPIGTSDPRVCAGLELPIAGVAGDQQSALFGQACFDEGDTKCTYGTGSFLLTNTGATIQRSDTGLISTAAWRSPDGDLTYASEGAVFAPGADHQWLRDSLQSGDHAAETEGTEQDALEAIALGVRDVLKMMPRTEGAALRVGGGAAENDLLCQIQADQVGVPVERPKVVEATALGAAFLAGLGTGVWSSTDELREIWALDRRFTPSTAATLPISPGTR